MMRPWFTMSLQTGHGSGSAASSCASAAGLDGPPASGDRVSRTAPDDARGGTGPVMQIARASILAASAGKRCLRDTPDPHAEESVNISLLKASGRYPHGSSQRAEPVSPLCDVSPQTWRCPLGAAFFCARSFRLRLFRRSAFIPSEPRSSSSKEMALSPKENGISPGFRT